MGKDKHKLKRKLLDLLFSSSEDESDCKKRKNRVIRDSESEDDNATHTERPISPQFLEKIGHVAEKDISFNLNKDIAKIWQNILTKGLDEENRSKIMENIGLIKDLPTAAPALNAEIKASLTQHALTRDEHLCKKQNQIGSAICGLSKILQERLDCRDTTTAEKLSNCIRLLCDVHNLESKTRRAVILPGLNKNVKDALEKTDITESLFGKNVSEVIKETRTIERSTKELRSQPLNNWGPSSSKRQGGLNEQKSTLPYRTRNYTANRRRQQQQRQHLRSLTKPQQRNRTQYPPRRQQSPRRQQ